MDIGDLFRGFFGFRSRENYRNDTRYDTGEDFPDQPYDEDDERLIFTDTNDIFRHFEQQFNEIFRNFGLMDFPPVMPGQPENLIPLEEDQEGSLRDRLLKVPDDSPGSDSPIPRHQTPTHKHPFFFGNVWSFPTTDKPIEARKDTDLDDRVSRGELDSLLSDQLPVAREPPISRSFFKSVTVKTVRTGDGKVEHHRTVRDGEGNVETTVTRTIGDQTHTVTTRTNDQAQQSTTERFLNTDPNQPLEFDPKWNKDSTSFRWNSDQSSREPGVGPNIRNDYNSLFDKLFGTWSSRHN